MNNMSYLVMPLLLLSTNAVAYVPTIQDTYQYSINTFFSYPELFNDKNNALNLFGEMRNFTKEENEAYNNCLSKLFKKTGKKRF